MENNTKLKKSMDNNKYSLIKALFIFYFVMLEFSEKTFTRSVRINIISDVLCKHLIKCINLAIILRYILKISDVDKLISQTFIAYMLFLLLSKIEYQWSIIMIGIFIIYFIIDTKMEHSDILNKKIDNVLNDKEKLIIHKKHNINRGIIIFILFATMIIGCGLYGKKKIVQYGGGFDLRKFIYHISQ